MKRKFSFFITFILIVLGVSAQDNQSLRDSLKKTSACLSYYPDSIELRLQKAALNMQLEQWEYAKDEYDIVLDRQPNNIAALFYRAFANEKMRRYGFARQDYNHLLMLVPANFEARLGLALLNQKDHHYTEAMDQINILVQQHPDSAIVYAARAGMEKEREMNELAIYDYSEAIRLEPENTDYLLSRADLFIREQRYKDAQKDLERMVSLGVPKSSLTEFFERVKKKK